MDKNAFLEMITTAARTQLASLDDIIKAYHQGITGDATTVSTQSITPTSATTITASIPTQQPAKENHINFGTIIAYLGGLVVFLGIAVMIGSQWTQLSDASKILTTLGTALVAYLIATLLANKSTYTTLTVAFYLISALTFPVGLAVAFAVFGLDTNTALVSCIITGIPLLVFGLSYYWRRHLVLIVFFVLFATAFFYSLTNLIFVEPIGFTDSFSYYRLLVIGLAYLCLGYTASFTTDKKVFTGWLYSFGALAFLGSALALGNNKPDANLFWEGIYPILVLGTVYISVLVKSRALLIWGAIFLMAYILKITFEYFSQGLGWPAALVLSGLAMIAIGYYTVYVNQRYIKKTTAV